jgi:hypothetical protein
LSDQDPPAGGPYLHPVHVVLQLDRLAEFGVGIGIQEKLHQLALHDGGQWRAVLLNAVEIDRGAARRRGRPQIGAHRMLAGQPVHLHAKVHHWADLFSRAARRTGQVNQPLHHDYILSEPRFWIPYARRNFAAHLLCEPAVDFVHREVDETAGRGLSGHDEVEFFAGVIGWIAGCGAKHWKKKAANQCTEPQHAQSITRELILTSKRSRQINEWLG